MRSLIRRCNSNLYFLFIFTFALLLLAAPAAKAALPADVISDIKSKITLWQSHVINCQNKSDWSPDPSMHEPDNPSDNCSSSDMNLFNGLLCAAGSKEGCLAVQRAQTANGRWWRSPFRALHSNCTLHDVQNNADPETCSDKTFSADMDLGTQLYSAITADKGRLQSWLVWIENNRPCTYPNPFDQDSCALRGTPRYCIDINCTMKWDGALMLIETVHALGLDVPEGIDGMKQTNLMSISSWIYQSTVQSNEGFSLHLAGVQLFLLRNILHRGDVSTLNSAAAQLNKRQPLNPFFAYLNKGPTVDVWNMVTASCPANDAQIQNLTDTNVNFRTDWVWQRADKANAWKDSSLWDCIFMAQIVLNQDNFINPLSEAKGPTQAEISGVLSVINNLILND